MKRQVTLWDRLRVFFMWVRQQEGYGLTASCDFCRSSKIQRLKSQVKQIDEDSIQFNALYKCMNCGADASIEEVWMKGEIT